jgi:hypothetical protein
MLSCGVSLTGFVWIWLADIFTSGIAGLAVCVTGYLLWLYFHKKPARGKREQERHRQRRSHWGYE